MSFQSTSPPSKAPPSNPDGPYDSAGSTTASSYALAASLWPQWTAIVNRSWSVKGRELLAVRQVSWPFLSYSGLVGPLILLREAPWTTTEYEEEFLGKELKWVRKGRTYSEVAVKGIVEEVSKRWLEATGGEGTTLEMMESGG